MKIAIRNLIYRGIFLALIMTLQFAVFSVYAEPQPASSLFDPGIVHHIDIAISEEEWDDQYSSGADLVYTDDNPDSYAEIFRVTYQGMENEFLLEETAAYVKKICDLVE